MANINLRTLPCVVVIFLSLKGFQGGMLQQNPLQLGVKLTVKSQTTTPKNCLQISKHVKILKSSIALSFSPTETETQGQVKV